MKRNKSDDTTTPAGWHDLPLLEVFDFASQDDCKRAMVDKASTMPEPPCTTPPQVLQQYTVPGTFLRPCQHSCRYANRLRHWGQHSLWYRHHHCCYKLAADFARRIVDANDTEAFRLLSQDPDVLRVMVTTLQNLENLTVMQKAERLITLATGLSNRRDVVNAQSTGNNMYTILHLLILHGINVPNNHLIPLLKRLKDMGLDPAVKMKWFGPDDDGRFGWLTVREALRVDEYHNPNEYGGYDTVYPMYNDQEIAKQEEALTAAGL